MLGRTGRIEEGLVLKAKDTWPRSSRVYCFLVEDPWPEDAEVLERVPVIHCRRRGVTRGTKAASAVKTTLPGSPAQAVPSVWPPASSASLPIGGRCLDGEREPRSQKEQTLPVPASRSARLGSQSRTQGYVIPPPRLNLESASIS